MISKIAGLTQGDSSIRVVANSDAMRRVEREALQAARWEANVLIAGERGVGKAVVARFIHDHSGRSPYGFATIRCEGLPDLLFESALFGHVQGSFAGAYRDKPGLVESVPGGTIFLDDVHALSPRMQARLLRFLQTGEYQRIGGERAQTSLDVRVIVATTTNLLARVAAGLFLDELSRRLSVLRLSVPPLRERHDDIPSLVDHFAGEFGERVPLQSGAPEVSTVDRDALCRADWPGNVRELKDIVLRQLLNAARATAVESIPRSL